MGRAFIIRGFEMGWFAGYRGFISKKKASYTNIQRGERGGLDDILFVPEPSEKNDH